ncbi:hypothetical protein B0H11DRAFT_2231869 [Mycena galericulata]|nr:hypothetical protein B0H11DRAFT_2231869 [Mycena galericulata]
MAEAGVLEGDEREPVEQARTYGMRERERVHKVYLSQKASHRLKDQLRAADTQEQKHNWIHDAKVEGGLGIYNDPYMSYSSPQLRATHDAQ